eukprot:scaffold1202_cov384-Prasinococcus_capsulatus_cf.AAC.5
MTACCAAPSALAMISTSQLRVGRGEPLAQRFLVQVLPSDDAHKALRRFLDDCAHTPQHGVRLSRHEGQRLSSDGSPSLVTHRTSAGAPCRGRAGPRWCPAHHLRACGIARSTPPWWPLPHHCCRGPGARNGTTVGRPKHGEDGGAQYQADEDNGTVGGSAVHREGIVTRLREHFLDPPKGFPSPEIH